MGLATELLVAALALAPAAFGVRLQPQPAGSEDACAIPEGFHVVSVKDSQVGPMKVVVREEFRKDIISRGLTNRGYWEIRHPRELGELAGVKMPVNGTFLDIGANLGWYSLLFAKVGYDVIAVEPMAHNRLALEASLCLNPDIRHRVRLLPVALVAPEDTKQRCFLHSTPGNRGNGILACSADDFARLPCGDAGGPKECASEEVKVSTLDALLQEQHVKSVDVAKMDVEGFECNVLKGGQSLFGRLHVKLLQAETKLKPVEECFDREAKSHKYRMGKGVGPDGNRVISSLARREEEEEEEEEGELRDKFFVSLTPLVG